MQGTPPTVVILGLPFHCVTFDEAVAWARQRILARQPGYIATVNMDFVMQAWRDPELQRILLEADLVVADGIPIVWLSGLLGPRLPARVTGSDMVPLLAEMARDNGFSLFHLGGAPGVAEKAAEVLCRRFPGLRLAGCYAPPWSDFLDMNHAEILGRLETAKPDLLLVAFGAPKQEKWVNMHLRNWQVPLAIGVGGTLDFLAGRQKRAPRIVQRLALEWVWRMCSDPRRLARRYRQNLGFYLRSLGNLLRIRCQPDRPVPPVAGGTTLRDLAYVASFTHLSDTGQAAAYCAALSEQAANRPVVLDLSGVRWLSSLEQGVLLRLTTQFRQRKQRLLLVGAGSRVYRMLSWCHLTEYLELCQSPAELLKKIGAGQADTISGGIQQDAATGRVVVRLPAELTAANLAAFRHLLDGSQGFCQAREQVLDASGTCFVDSSAVGYFVWLKQRAAAQQRTLCFVGAQPRVCQIFRIAKVDNILL
jgi:N-acetylglucosaminyldiphosphoundecaprenol N-acetyl-beta-D-mannosaminyltransferase